MTDGQMLERFITKRDESAFEGLVLRHGPMVLGVCRQILRDNHEAEDAFQATFLILARNAQTIRNLDSLASWLYGVAYRLSLRAKTTVRPRVYEGRSFEMAASDTGNDLEHSELRPVLHEEVSKLPEKYRAPIVLCFFEGQTHEEAASQLECPVGTVKGRLARAKEMLRGRLSRRGMALPLALVAFLHSQTVNAAISEELVGSTLNMVASDALPTIALSDLVDRPGSHLTFGLSRAAFVSILLVFVVTAGGFFAFGTNLGASVMDRSASWQEISTGVKRFFGTKTYKTPAKRCDTREE
jgi:RNA polymerase sigma factor (sigma-70 family)